MQTGGLALAILSEILSETCAVPLRLCDGRHDQCRGDAVAKDAL